MGILNNEGDNIQASMKEVYEDLRNFKETRKSVEELIKYRAALMDAKEKGVEADRDKMNDYKGKAFDAINNLFNNKD